MGLVAADTYTYSDGSGTWSGGGGDGATEVSTTITPTYEVIIPDTLELPQTATFTDEEDNVSVAAGAQIPADASITVSLEGGQGRNDQTFSAKYEGQAVDAVDYLVQLNDEEPIPDTSFERAKIVINVDAETAHTAGATGSINVGFNDTPDFKYSGKYSQAVQFTVTALPDSVK